MKLFEDHEFTKAHQTCENIRRMCRERELKDRQQTGKIAEKSIKNLVKN